MGRFRKQLILACATVVLVIALAAVTGVVALRSAVDRTAHARAIERQIVLIESLREHTRDIAASARRFMYDGDHKEQQRVLAIIDDMRHERDELQARFLLPYGPALETGLDTYQLGVINALADFPDDPVERLTRFEDRLTGLRVPLTATFDDLVTQERSQRAAMQDASSLGRSAQWTLVLASSVGIVLVIGVCIAVLRQLARR